MKSKRIIIVALAVAAAVAAVWCVQTFTGWESIAVPLDSESSLRISRKHTHPYLAEYQRKVAVFHSGRRLATLSYPEDTGGGFPMQVRFYADSTRRVVRITDRIYDRLIDLRTGQFVPDETPLDGKELSSFIREAALPTLRRSVEIGRDMQLAQRDSALMTVPPNQPDRGQPRPALGFAQPVLTISTLIRLADRHLTSRGASSGGR